MNDNVYIERDSKEESRMNNEIRSLIDFLDDSKWNVDEINIVNRKGSYSITNKILIQGITKILKGMV